MCNNCSALAKAIDAYLAKADNDLEKQLKREGFALPKLTVMFINELEEIITHALLDETAFFLSAIESAENYEIPDGEPPIDNSTVIYLDIAKAAKNNIESNVNLKKFAKYIFPNLKYDDAMAGYISNGFVYCMQKYFPCLINAYIKQTDKELKLNSISQKTTAWVNSWGQELGNLMQLTSHKQIQDILVDGLNEGIGIPEFTQKIQESGIRDEYYRARRVAVTEVLRAHNVSAQEAYSQSPAVTQKRWRHTGSYRNKPRENHQMIDGQIVYTNEAFTLPGIKGGWYSPMFPCDPVLPPEETINCHCLSQPIVEEAILGLSLDEREQLQQQAIANMDDSWKAQLDAENKQKALDYYANGGQKPAPAPKPPVQFVFPLFVPKVPKADIFEPSIGDSGALSRSEKRLLKRLDNIYGGDDKKAEEQEIEDNQVAVAKYEQIKNLKDDVKNIAANTIFNEKAIAEIKEYMFYGEALNEDGSRSPFDPDRDQAEAWLRLAEGKGTENDLLLLKHEYIELCYVKRYNSKYIEAHNHANKKYCWYDAMVKEHINVLENLKSKRDN